MSIPPTSRDGGTALPSHHLKKEKPTMTTWVGKVQFVAVNIKMHLKTPQDASSIGSKILGTLIFHKHGSHLKT